MLAALIPLIAGLFLFVPAPGHFDHGVGGERRVFEGPSAIDKPAGGSVLRFERAPVIYVPYLDPMNAERVSIQGQAWIDPEVEGTSPGAVVSRWHQVQGEATSILYADGGEMGGFLVAVGEGREERLTGYELPRSRWFEYGATVDETEMAVFVDGFEVARRPVEGPLTPSRAPLWIGATHAGVPFPGMVGRVEFTAGTVAMNWAPGSDVETSGPVRIARSGDREAWDLRPAGALPLGGEGELEGPFTVAAWVLNRGVANGGGPTLELGALHQRIARSSSTASGEADSVSGASGRAARRTT